MDVVQTDTRINAKESDLCVWWIRNPPTAPEYWPVANIEEAAYIINKTANFDLKDPRISANAGGLEVFEDGEWGEWYDDNGDDIDKYL